MKASELFGVRIKASGSGNCAAEGSETTVAHGLSVAPSMVYAMPSEDPAGNLGELWARADGTNVYIGNSGSFIGGFVWIAV